MSIYTIIRNLSVAVLLTTSISFAMQDEGKNPDDVNKARLREFSFPNGMPLLTTGDMDGLPLLSSGGVDHTALAALFESSSIASNVPVNSSSAVLAKRRDNPADFDGMPLLTTSSFANLPSDEAEACRTLFETLGKDRASAYLALSESDSHTTVFAPSSVASSDPVVSTRLAFEAALERENQAPSTQERLPEDRASFLAYVAALESESQAPVSLRDLLPIYQPSQDSASFLAFEETSEQTIARTTVPASFIESLLGVSGGYVEREDLDESESTSDQAKHIVISLVNRINTLEANKVYARECASAKVTYTQEQVNDMFAAYASLGMTLPSADNV